MCRVGGTGQVDGHRATNQAHLSHDPAAYALRLAVSMPSLLARRLLVKRHDVFGTEMAHR
jgi:hypothetical protein